MTTISSFSVEKNNMRVICNEVQRATPLIPPHSHTISEFIFILSGGGTYHVDGRVYTIKKFDMVYTRPGKHHYLILNTDEPYARVNIHYDTARINSALIDSIPKTVDVLNFGENDRVKSIFTNMPFYYENLDGEARIELFESLIVQIICSFAIAATGDGAIQTASTNPLIEKALKYIKEHLYEIESVDEICREIYVTKSHLHHLFMENLRITPKRYIKEKRLIRARRRILDGEKPTSVFRDCGFGDYASFYRNYKAYYGYSPSLEGDAEAMGAKENFVNEREQYLAYF